MTEQELEQALNETTGFLARQRLLKQLWQLQRQRESQELAARSTRSRQSRQPTPRVATPLIPAQRPKLWIH